MEMLPVKSKMLPVKPLILMALVAMGQVLVPAWTVSVAMVPVRSAGLGNKLALQSVCASSEPALPFVLKIFPLPFMTATFMKAVAAAVNQFFA